MATQSLHRTPVRNGRRAPAKEPSEWGNRLIMWMLYGGFAVGTLLFLGIIYIVLLS